MPSRDLQRFETVAARVVQAIADVRGRRYTPTTGIRLYQQPGRSATTPTAATVAAPFLPKTYGYSFETGPQAGNVRDSFHPPDPEPIKREADSGLLALAQQCI